MAKKSVQTSPTNEELLKEYEYCQKTAQSMERTIWQTGAAMSLGLVGSFLLIALRAPEDQPAWYFACLVGPFMALVALLWWFAARRWWSVQHAMFIRMRHVERRLGLHSLWYVQYIDHPDLIPESGLNKDEIADLKKRSSSRDRLGIRRHQHWGVQATLWVLPILLFAAWWIYSLVLLLTQIFGAD
jgi:hypothetical protein